MTDTEKLYQEVRKVVELAHAELSSDWASSVFFAGYYHGKGCKPDPNWRKEKCGTCGWLRRDRSGAASNRWCRSCREWMTDDESACPEYVSREEVPE